MGRARRALARGPRGRRGRGAGRGSAGTAGQLGLATEPATTAQSGLALTTQPVVQIQDASGNLVSSAAATLVTATTVSGTGTLTSATATTSGGGAPFRGLALAGAAGGC